MWPALAFVLVSVVVRAAGRRCAARRLGPRAEPSLLHRRLALALSGPAAVYLAAAILATLARLVQGEPHETNVVATVQRWETSVAWSVCERPGLAVPEAVRGLAVGDEIVALDSTPTPDGDALRRALGRTPVRDGEVELTLRRDGAYKRFCVFPVRSTLPFPAGWLPPPEPGVSLRRELRPVDLARALWRGVAFPAAPVSRIRWLFEIVTSRAALRVREEELTHLPPVPFTSSPLFLADVMGLFALAALFPWPGLDGGELLLVAYQLVAGGPPAWLASLFRSRLWGTLMAVASAFAVFLLWASVNYVLGERQDWVKQIFRWPG